MSRTLVAVMALAACLSCAPGEPDAPPTEEAPAQGASPARATLEEATAMLDLAEAHYEEVGRDMALEDFTGGRMPFIDRDLYVFCYGPDRTISAHGADPGLVGDAIDELRDVDGKAFGTEIWEVGSQSDGGTVEYQWINPATGAVEPKTSVVRKLGEDVCGVGAYGGE